MLKIGQFLGDRYEILTQVGVGGMAEVYRAKDHKLNRMVAVKVLKDEFNDAMLLSGRTMEVVDALGNSLAKGIAQGVDERGYLLLEREDGSVQAVASGEVHVLC